MRDGIITLDTKRGKALGFSSDLFDHGSYLWKVGNAISISFIASKQRGNFRSLVQRILGQGLTVKIPTPLGRMEQIVKKNGYTLTQEPFDPPEDLSPVNVWVLSPQASPLMSA